MPRFGSAARGPATRRSPSATSRFRTTSSASTCRSRPSASACRHRWALMVDGDRVQNSEAWITGIGIVSSLGEGADAHWVALQNGTVNVDTKTYAPYMVHPLAPLNFDQQIPKKGDQRQMEAWQRIGTYAAGLALDSAGLKGNAEVLGRTDMIVAAGGGERDITVDSAILNAKVQGNAAPNFLNE